MEWKNLKTFAVIATFGLLLSACGGSSDDKQNDQNEGDEGISLSVPFNEGETVRWIMTQTEEVESEAGPQGPWSMKNELVLVMDEKLEKVDGAEGDFVTTYKSVEITAGSDPGGMQYHYHSDSAPNPQMRNEIQMHDMVGKQVRYRMNNRAVISKLNGAAGLMAHMFDDSAAYTGDDHLREMLNLAAFYPDGKVKVGDSWTRTAGQRSFYPILCEDTFTLKEATDDGYVIGLEGKISPNPESVPTMEEGMEIDYVLNGTHTGTFTLDKNGALLHSTVTFDMKGETTAGMPGEEAMKMPVHIRKTETQERKAP